LLATLNLTNYSEFGLIIAAIGVNNGWIDSEWLVVIAIALSVSYVGSSWLNSMDDKIYRLYRTFWCRFQHRDRLADDLLLDTRGATIVIFGMGRVGSGAYDKMRELHGDTVIGFDFNADKIKKHQSLGRNVLPGDPSDADFWEKIEKDHSIKLVMLALPNLQAKLDALAELQEISFSGQIAAIARFPDDMTRLQQSGATAVFNIYTEAGAGFAEHVEATS
jgi:glutathione-regulated potassium-efflux system ancillary protein KefC